jgi:phosphoglycolate phosphatase-like HAD superfamily hydrolase
MQMSGARRALVALYHPKQEERWLGRLLARLGKVVPLIPAIVPEGIILLSFSPRARKPSPWGLQWLARGRPAVFYGDEDTDRLAAEAAGAKFVLVQGE